MSFAPAIISHFLATQKKGEKKEKKKDSKSNNKT
jgi:hypothetical protein